MNTDGPFMCTCYSGWSGDFCDAKWDWTVDREYDLYSKALNAGEYRREGLGHFDHGLDPDGYKFRNPDHGWTLLYHDFGAEGKAGNPTFPYHCLYNYLTGIVTMHDLGTMPHSAFQCDAIGSRERAEQSSFQYSPPEATKKWHSLQKSSPV